MKTLDHHGTRIYVGLPGSGAEQPVRLGRYQYAQARHGLSPHQHGETMEICFMASGSQTYEVDEQLFTLRGNDVFVTFPREVHSTGGLPEEKGMLYWLLLPLGEQAFPWLPRQQADDLREALLALPQRHFRGVSEMRGELDCMLALVERTDDPLRGLRTQAHLLAFLLAVIDSAEQAPPDAPSELLRGVLDHIDDHLEEELPLGDLAELADLSLSRFKTRFKREVGMPPGSWIARRRVDAAKERLRTTSYSITRIAFDLGFSSSQYFATVFRRYTGASPSAWRREQTRD